MFLLTLLLATGYVSGQGISLQVNVSLSILLNNSLMNQINEDIDSISHSATFLAGFCNISLNETENFIQDFAFVDVDSSLVTFYIYASSSNQIPVSSSNISSYLTAPKTVILVHTWRGNRTADNIVVMADAYVAAGGYNVVVVDWSGLADGSYCEAATGVQGVGKWIGLFIYDISKTNSNFVTNLHVVGFSFGAHCAGFAGNTFYSLTGTKLPWITGNDPAGPLFENLGIANNMLSKDDAIFVDAIHTDVGIFGTTQTCGQIDFLVNCGGPFQPMCEPYLANTTMPTGFFSAVFCSHQQSCFYFAKTVTNRNAYLGTTCTACSLTLPIGSLTPQPMGEGVNKNSKGVYCVTAI